MEEIKSLLQTLETAYKNATECEKDTIKMRLRALALMAVDEYDVRTRTTFQQACQRLETCNFWPPENKDYLIKTFNELIAINETMMKCIEEDMNESRRNFKI